jgi:hypothetical protein
MSETAQANDGAMLPLSSLPTQIVYAGGFVSTIQVQYQGNTYTQTFLNDGTDIIYISGWVNSNSPQSQQVMTDQSGNVMLDQSGNIMVTQ